MSEQRGIFGGKKQELGSGRQRQRTSHNHVRRRKRGGVPPRLFLKRATSRRKNTDKQWNSAVPSPPIGRTKDKRRRTTPSNVSYLPWPPLGGARGERHENMPVRRTRSDEAVFRRLRDKERRQKKGEEQKRKKHDALYPYPPKETPKTTQYTGQRAFSSTQMRFPFDGS